MTTNAVPPTDCQILQFKHLFKLKTDYDHSKSIYSKPTHLIAVSSEFGLTFVGEKNNLKVVANDKLFENNCPFDSKTIIREYFHKDIPLPYSPSHIDINSEQKLLAVSYCAQEVPVLRIFVIETICAESASYYPEIRLSSTSGTHVTDLSWNPGIPNILACCVSDGTLSTYTFNAMGHFEIKSLPRESNSLCICWSPKGKQIAVGNYNGFLTQYVPDLKAVKNFPPPTGLFPKACTLCSIKWLSNFQFIGVYKTQEENLIEDEEIKSCVVVINTPKNGPISYINYDDICFSSGIERPVQFYFTHIPSWNLIFVSSSNSVEVAVLNIDKDGITWILWNLEPEENRITLPILKSGEAFPVGVAIDYVSRFQVSLGDRVISMPIFSIMTWEGLTCVYLVNYLNHAVPDICTKTSVSLPLQYFSMEPINDEDPICSQPPIVEEVAEVSLNQFTATSPDVSYTIEQPTYPSKNVFASSTLNEMTSILGEMPKIAPSFTNSNPSYTFETSITTTITSEPISVIAIPKIQNQSQHALSVNHVHQQNNFNKISLSNIKAIGNVKKSDPSKSRQEILKKLKKRASVFENDIQEIKYLVNNIKIDERKIPHQRREISLKLNTESKKLKEYNVKLRNDINVLKSSLIEAFACVQDIKSKLFQIKNPGYQSLSGIQDIDPVSQNNLKGIENTINYIQTQVEKANKQLEECWYKFTENTKTPTTKVPLLENIYETMVKQQKILNFLRLQTEKLQKKFAAIIQRLSKNKSSISGDKLDSSLPWSSDRFLNESMSLDDLTKQALNLNTSDDLQPKILAHKLSQDYAKRFHLSYAKQVKLQELLNTGSVTNVQSGRLQRLKKKSLIILSKNSYVPEPAEEEGKEKDSDVTTPVENIRTNTTSPVSSDDGVNPSQVDSIISSTPLKNTTPPKFTLENLLPTLPSVTKQEITTLNKSAFSLPSSISLIPITSEGKKIDSKILEPVSVPTFRQISKVEQSSNDYMTAVTPSISTSQLPQSSVTTAIPITCTGSFFGTVKPMTTTQVSSLFSNVSTTSLFSINPMAPSVTIGGSSVNTTNISLSALSYVGVETTAESITPSSSLSSGSLFGIKPTFDMPSMVTVTSSSPMIGGSPIKSSSFVSLPSIGCLTATSQAASAPVTSPSISVKGPTALLAISTMSPVVTSMRTIFNSAPTAFSKPNTSEEFNFGSALSSHSLFAGKPTTFATSFTVTATAQKDVSFNKFSFATADTSAPADTLTITEVTSEADSIKTKENENNIISTTTPFSFASLGTLSSMPTKSDVATVSTTIVTLPLTTAEISSLFGTPPNETPVTSSATVTVVASTSGVRSIMSQPTVASTPSTSATGSGFDNAGSFFGNLNLGLPAVISTSNSIFGSSLSSAPSFFGGTSGGNIFSQAQNTYVAVTSANESKPLFGSSTPSPLFGGSSVTSTGTKNIFGSSGNFQSGTSLFVGTSSRAPLFGSSSTFGRGSVNQGNTFATGTAGGSLFSNARSGFASPFQNTGDGFGSPPSFGSGLQQPSNTGGFGSPPSFSTFGGAPTFGGSPSFGNSPTKVFGQTSTNMGTFGGATPQAVTGFENLANNDNTVTFGNLAQQQMPSAQFGSPPNFSNDNAGAFGSPKFGGGNFSSWR